MTNDTTSQAQSTPHTARTAQWKRFIFRRGGLVSTVIGGLYPWRRDRSRWTVVAVLTLVLAGMGPGLAMAQTVLDVARTPVVGSGRVVGMGGAYTGVGEGAQGYFRNPAALANRANHAVDWYEWDLAFDWILYPGETIDSDNDGEVGPEGVELQTVNLSLGFQWGRFGFGLTVEPSTFRVLAPGTEDVTHELGMHRNAAGFAWAFQDGTWILGAGFGDSEFRVVDHLNQCTNIDKNGDESVGDCEVAYRAQALDLGVLYRPPGEPWRVGLGYRRGAVMEVANEVPPAVAQGGIPLPTKVEEPDTLTWGISYLMGASDIPYNHPIRSGGPWGKKRKKELAGSRDERYLLLAADLVWIGPTVEGATSFESFISGQPRRSGEKASLSLHLGAEAVALADRLVVRAGTYTEPDRIHGDNLGRLHLTGGFDLKLMKAAWMWRLGFAFDAAPRYKNVMVGLGFWPTSD